MFPGKNDTVNVKEVMEILRLQKHDFLNYMQIINGYLQLGNTEKALSYVKKAAREIEESGAIMTIAHPGLGINLLLWVHNAYKSGVEVKLSTCTDLEKLEPDTDILDLFRSVFMVIEEFHMENRIGKQVQMQFSEDNDNYYFTIIFVPCSQDACSGLKEQVELISGGRFQISAGVGDSEDNAGALRMVFPKYDRSC